MKGLEEHMCVTFWNEAFRGPGGCGNLTWLFPGKPWGISVPKKET